MNVTTSPSRFQSVGAYWTPALKSPQLGTFSYSFPKSDVEKHSERKRYPPKTKQSSQSHTFALAVTTDSAAIGTSFPSYLPPSNSAFT